MRDRPFVARGESATGDQLAGTAPVMGQRRDRCPRDGRGGAGGLVAVRRFRRPVQGTNRSLTIEAMTVNDAELAWVTAPLDMCPPDAHRHEGAVETQTRAARLPAHPLLGRPLRPFVDTGPRPRGVGMSVPAHLFAAPLPVVAAYLPASSRPGLRVAT